jgi:hypothetical protein
MAKLVLELELEPALIDRIASAAKAKKVSLTEYTEKLFRKDIEQIDPVDNLPFKVDENLSDWVKSLMLAKTPTPDFDHKEKYGDHIMRKYGL